MPLKSITPSEAAALVTADRVTNPIHSLIEVRVTATLVKQYQLVTATEAAAFPSADRIEPSDRSPDINDVVWLQTR